MTESFPNGKKTLWEKDKLLVTSNLSFSHIVFKRLALQTRKNQGLFGKGLRVGLCILPFKEVSVCFAPRVFESYKGLGGFGYVIVIHFHNLSDRKRQNRR